MYLSGHKWKYIINFYSHAIALVHKIKIASKLKAIVDRHGKENIVFYSYWFTAWTFILCVLKCRLKEISIVTRAHGGDLYEERAKPYGYFPFRSFQMSMINKIAVVSGFGKNYLAEKYPRFSGKIIVSRCGVSDNGTNPKNKIQPALRLVSCSSLVALKRVHLIIDILKHITIETEWIHFGGGALLESLKEQAKKLPSNIKAVFKGSVLKKEIISFYKNNPVDFFIHVSQTEGIPFSIMEAISFGIPVIASGVGGVPEIVNEKTGILIPADFRPAETAALIIRNYEMGKNSSVNRNEVKNYWQHNFNADDNYEYFVRNILLG